MKKWEKKYLKKMKQINRRFFFCKFLAINCQLLEVSENGYTVKKKALMKDVELE